MDKDSFLNPIGSYHGDFSPENLAFDQNLQEFSNKISIIVSLENGGKISPTEAYKRIKKLFKELKSSKKGLYEN